MNITFKVFQAASELTTPNKTEMLWFAMRPELLVYYVYLCLVYDFFQCRFASIDRTIKKLKDLNLPAIDNETIADLAVIHSTFSTPHKDQYIYEIRNMQFPWNYTILSAIERDRKDRRTGISKTGEIYKLSYVENMQMRRLVDDFPRQYIEDILLDMFEGKTKNYLNLETCQTKWIKNKLNNAPMVNGTACVGKTSLMLKTLDAVHKHIDENAMILKIGSYGSFMGKDENQILAMGTQITMKYLTENFYTSISDRCIFNNLIWRIILAMMNPNDDIKKIAYDHLQLLTHVMIDAMSKEPIVVILDSDCVANRARMMRRATGADCARSCIENYVVAQNMIYGTLGVLCNWLIIDVAVEGFEVYEKLSEILVEKINRNVTKRGMPTIKPYESFTQQVDNIPKDDDTTYEAAKKLAIMK